MTLTRSEAGKLGYQKTAVVLKATASRQHLDAKQKYAAHPKSCRTCGKPIPYERRRSVYCDHSCAASNTNRGRDRHQARRSPRGCRVCGTPVFLKRKCCDACVANGFALGRAPTLQDARTDKTRKAYLLRTRERKCSACGLAVWQGQPIPLDLDHADGDADHNTEDNLRLLCPNCHALTTTYKGRNQGKNSGRQKKRRQRYKDGKTY